MTRRAAHFAQAAIVAAIAIVLATACDLGSFGYGKPTLENPLDPAVSVPLESITFGDPDFRDIVFNSANTGDTNSVTRINEDGSLVTSLEGIQYLSNLEELYLWGPSGISDLTPVGQLRRLRWMGLNDAAITDLSPLASVRSLEEFDVRHNDLTDLSPLASLPNFRRLWVSGLLNGGPGYTGTVADIFATLSVDSIGLSDFDLGDPDELAALQSQSLDEAWLEGCNLGSFPSSGAIQLVRSLAVQWDPTISSLPAARVTFPNLENLHLSGLDNPTIDWNDLANIQAPNLRWFEVQNLPLLTTLPPLSSFFPGLEEVRLGYCGFTSMDMLIGLDGLWGVGFEGNPVSDFSALAELGSLTQLWLRDSGFTDSDFVYIQSLPNLFRLEIPENPGVTNLNPLASMSLEYLHIANCTGITTLELGDIAGIQRVYAREEGSPSITALGPALPPTAIEYLDLTGQFLTDAANLATLTSLRELQLADNNISSGVTELAALTNLEYLDLRNNPISLVDIEFLQENLPNTFIDFLVRRVRRT
jgi:Leucine-rich repeat (LRR) protein